MNLLIGENIKRIRRERDLTQEEVAAHLGISFQSISKCSCTVKKQATENNR